MLLPDNLTKIIIIQFCLLLSTLRGEDHRPLKGRVYFAIAATPSTQGYSRAFNKTIMNITSNYLMGKSGKIGFNISLETVVIDLPENGNFSAVLLEGICEKLEAKRVVAVLIIGHSPAAFTVSITAKHAGIPVLWAREYGQSLPGFRSMLSNEFNEAYKARVNKALTECRKDPATHFSKEDAKSTVPQKTSDEAKFILCLLKKLGTINAQGRVDKEGMRNDLMLAFNDSKKVDAIIEKCYEDDPSVLPEEAAANNFICVMLFK